MSSFSLPDLPAMPRSRLPASVFLILLSSCASAGHLAEYDYRGRSLAVVSTLPPQPTVVIEEAPEPEGGRWWQYLLRFGSEAVRDAQADRAGEKMAKVAESVDLTGLMADGVLERSARLLGARPVASVREADFEMEVRVSQYGIQASDWDAAAGFYIHAQVLLLEAATGREIWEAEVDAWDTIRGGFAGALGNLLTARALADLSVEDMERAMEALADYSATEVARRLEAGLEEAGKR